MCGVFPPHSHGDSALFWVNSISVNMYYLAVQAPDSMTMQQALESARATELGAATHRSKNRATSSWSPGAPWVASAAAAPTPGAQTIGCTVPARRITHKGVPPGRRRLLIMAGLVSPHVLWTRASYADCGGCGTCSCTWYDREVGRCYHVPRAVSRAGLRHRRPALASRAPPK